MYDVYFVFKSMTASQQAMWELRKFGIDAALVRIPKQISPNGCGYGLVIDSAFRKNAIGILQNCGIPYTAIIPKTGSMV